MKRCVPAIIIVFSAAVAAALLPCAAHASRGSVEFLPLRAGAPDRVGWFNTTYGMSGIIIAPIGTNGFASDDVVRATAGTATIEVTKCTGPANMRTAAVHITASDWDHQEVVDQLLRKAVVRTWKRCPKPHDPSIDGSTADLDMQAVDIYGSDQSLLFEARDLRGNNNQELTDDRRDYNHVYHWQNWTSVAALARQQEVQTAQALANEARTEAFFGSLWRWFRILAFVGVLVWAAARWEIILRFWYGLTPHPAKRIVDAAVRNGESIDIDELRGALETKPANGIMHAVRVEQLNAETARVRSHHAVLSADLAGRRACEQELAEKRAQAERHYRLGLAEEGLLKATLAHQTTAAQVEVFRNREG